MLLALSLKQESSTPTSVYMSLIGSYFWFLFRTPIPSPCNTPVYQFRLAPVLCSQLKYPVLHIIAIHFYPPPPPHTHTAH